MAVKNSRAAVRRWLSLLLLLLLLLWAAAIIRDRYWPPKVEAPLAAPGATRNTDAPATSGTQAAPRLEFTVADGGKHVSGSFGDVRFEAQALGAKQARARFWLPGSDEQQVTVAIEGVTQGLLTWQAHEITGRGAVDDVTAEALATLAQGPMAAALATVPRRIVAGGPAMVRERAEIWHRASRGDRHARELQRRAGAGRHRRVRECRSRSGTPAGHLRVRRRGHR